MPASTPPGQLRNFDQLIFDNVGGVEALWYADVADVLSVPDPDEPLISTDVVLQPGACWYQLVATRTTLGFTQAGKSDRHGPFFQPQLKGVLAKATAALAAGLEALDGRRFVLLYRDNNGLVWLVGSLDEPLTFSDKYDAGTVTARNNYDFTFSGETTRRARPYTGTWLVSGRGLSCGLQLNPGPSGTVELRTSGGRLLAIVPAGHSIVLKSDFKLSYQIV
jgi:hypothetical protein